MPGPSDILQQMMRSNPAIQNNPNNKPIISAIMNNDAKSGEQLAKNYCQSFGMDWNQALQSAKAFLGLP